MILNHEGAKTQRKQEFSPVSAEIEHLATEVVDSAFKVHSTLIKDGIKRIVL